MKTATSPLLEGSILDEQIRLEHRAVEEGVKLYRRLVRESVERGEGAALKPVERMLLHWHKSMTLAVRAEQRACRRGEPGIGRCASAAVILALTPQRLAVITIYQMLSRCLKDVQVAQASMAYAIGRAVIAEIHHDMIRRQPGGSASLRALDRRFRQINPLRVNWWARRTLDNPIWERTTCTRIGSLLMWLLIGVANANDYEAGGEFRLCFHQRRHAGRKRMILLDHRVTDIIEQGHLVRQFLRPVYEPMIVQPCAWTDKAEGGYVRNKPPLISKITAEQKQAIVPPHADMARIHEAVDAVNATGFRVCRPILESMRALFHSGGGELGIPRKENYPLPPRPGDIDRDADIKRHWKRQAHDIYSSNKKLKSIRKGFQFKLAVAEAFADRPAIWFPHQLDFRGRAYPIPLHLNHQGDDVCRGLLEFSTAHKASTENNWVLVHAANCFGFDKLPFEERMRWAADSLPEICKSAAAPLRFTWWQKADKPWQFLQACCAIASASEGEGAQRLPIQIDGTCNGLQHYAALGRDEAGAAAVNMLPSDRPSDVYAEVAAAVRQRVEADARAGDELACRLTDAGIIDRDLVKQPVMTSVYGVTRHGAQAQIAHKLTKAGIEDASLRATAARYLSSIVLEGMAATCPAATEIMKWLATCARMITAPPNGTHRTLRWITPLGLPVVQPYRKYKSIQIRTVRHEIVLRVDAGKNLPIRRRKQINGFAPNFIHSIDATHMLMTALECRKAGIAFAAVHDSYWTHAATADALARILREQFIRLHRRPLLQELRHSLVERYGIELPPPPPPGGFDLSLVARSPYFFS